MPVAGIYEEPISEELRTTRRKRIALTTGAGLVACGAVWALTNWPAGNALGSAGLVAVIGALLWWAFGSRKAGRMAGRLKRGPRPQGLLVAKYWDNWKG